MAIHNDHPGLTVEIVVNGKALPDYDAPATCANPKVVTKYVEFKAGNEFLIGYWLEDPFLRSKRVRCHVGSGTMRPENREVFAMFRFKYRSRDELETLDVLPSEDGRTLSTPPQAMQTVSGTVEKNQETQLASVKQETPRTVPPTEDEQQLKSKTVTLRFSGNNTAILRQILRLLTERRAPLSKRGSRVSHQESMITRQATTLEDSRPQAPTPASEQAPRLSFPLRQRSATLVTSSLQPQFPTPAPPAEVDVDGLTDLELVALIKYYRGSDRGLAGQSRVRLQALLKYHEEKDTSPSTSILYKGATTNDGVTDERGREDDSGQEEQRKRKRLQAMAVGD